MRNAETPGRLERQRSRATGVDSVWSRRGMTLIDLSITVLVMGVLSAVALPKFSVVLASRRADAVARRVVADLEYARRTAMSTSQTTSVQFLTSPDRYIMTGVTHPNRPGEAYSVAFAELADGVRLQTAQFNTGNTLTYSVYGLPLVSGAPLTSGQVVVTSGNQSRTVTISPSTGKAELP